MCPFINKKIPLHRTLLDWLDITLLQYEIAKCISFTSLARIWLAKLVPVRLKRLAIE
jgi:hypothetical protein